MPPLLRQPDRAAAPLRGPALGLDAPPRRRPLWQLLFLVGVLGAALLWWQRGSLPPPPEPVEEFLSAPPSPSSPSSPPAPPATEPAAEPALAAPAAPSAPAPSSTASGATLGAPVHQDAEAAAETAAAPMPRPGPRPAPRAAATPPAPAPTVISGPEAACADSGRFTHSVCLGIQCLKAEFRRHPTCVRLDNEARERRQRERDHGLVGG